VDLRTLDLNLLVALDALLAERNVTRAAARLHLSQSATSAALARLREAFGDPLLLRTSGGMLPTLRGASLAAPVRQVLAEIERMVSTASSFDPRTAAETFRIAASDYVEFAILPQLVDHLEVHAPSCRLAVRAMDFTTVGQQLEAGEVDLAVLALQNAPPDLRSRPLYTERFVCVVRRDHPAAARAAPAGRMPLETFCALDHVLVSPRGAAFTAQTDEGLAAIGRRRNVRLAVPHFLLVPEILARTDMIAVLPERLARGYASRLAVMELPIDIPAFSIAAVWHERSHRGPPQAWLREALANLMHADELPLPTRPRSPARVNPPAGARRA
jgi:DNA-binding transcriptional LysR family regulator